MTEQEIIGQAINKAGKVRAAFLAEACAGDADLRRGVEILLWLHADTHRFLEESGLEQRAAVHSEPENAAAVLSFLAPSSEPGSLGRLDHYERVSEGTARPSEKKESRMGRQ